MDQRDSVDPGFVIVALRDQLNAAMFENAKLTALLAQIRSESTDKEGSDNQ